MIVFLTIRLVKQNCGKMCSPRSFWSTNLSSTFIKKKQKQTQNTTGYCEALQNSASAPKRRFNCINLSSPLGCLVPGIFPVRLALGISLSPATSPSVAYSSMWGSAASTTQACDLSVTPTKLLPVATEDLLLSYISSPPSSPHGTPSILF